MEKFLIPMLIIVLFVMLIAIITLIIVKIKLDNPDIAEQLKKNKEYDSEENIEIQEKPKE